MFKVIESQTIVPNIHLLTVEAPDVARSIRPGQFVILRVEDDGERIPLTASDWNSQEGTLSVAVMIVGHTSRKLAELRPGMSIPTVVGPLGNPIDIQKFGTVVCIGGCYGIGSIYPIAKSLKDAGNKVITVIEARSADFFFRDEKLQQVSDRLIYITRDGTKGYKGHVNSQLPIIINSLEEPIDRIFINGCNFLLKRSCDATRPLGIKTLVSLNTLMMDGTGMCGVCRVTIDNKVKFACVDGPYFDGHAVDWEELLQRRATYIKEETIPLKSSRAEKRLTRRVRITPEASHA